MDAKTFVADALRTEPQDYNFSEVNGVSPRIEHAAIGLASEVGELWDAIKKAKIYGKDLDKVNLIEEAGDIMWYLAILASSLDTSFEEIWDKNIRKLKQRFPEKYNSENALNRNLRKERTELEN